MSRPMKNSGIDWIGEIPEGWEVKKIKYLASQDIQDSFIDGDWIESPYIQDSGIRYLTTGNIGDGKFKEQGNGFISEETFKELNCKYAYPDDLVFSRLNSPYGRTCLLPHSFPKYVIAVDNVILRTNDNKQFISFVSQCAGYQKSVEDKASGTTMKRISRTNLGNIFLPMPPLPEQQRIADYLDRKCGEVDEMVALQEQMIEELKAYKQSVITETVTHGLNPNAPMKPSNIDWIGDIPEGWECCKLKYKMALLNGRAYSQDELLSEGKYRVLRVGNFFTNNSWYYSDMELPDNKYCYNGDLLYAWSASFGPKIWKGEKCIYHYHIWKVILNEMFLKYAFYLLEALSLRKSLDAHGTAMVHITMEEMNKSMIVVPSISEQREIAEYLDRKCADIDALIAIKQQKIEDLKEYKKSLIYEYVTGKKQVPCAS